MAAPADDTTPDLVALPAWDIQVTQQGSRDFIAFSATVWNAGPAPLLVEGYRRPNEAVMDAWQYFMRGDEVVGRQRVGTFEYDARPGHQHWHFQQFATYSLLDASRQQVELSKKEAFCLAPTDAIDMTVRDAEWQPGSTGLSTTCGDRSAIWIRETLETGWGDTYGQFLPGQALNITDLPNGTYFVAVEANAAGLLFENDTSNDRALRRIVLGGHPGHRTVTVPPWHGIDA